MANVIIKDFKTLSDFEKYINNTPLNEVFRWANHSSTTTEGEHGHFYGTKSFEEAVELFKHGWDDMSKKLEKQLKIKAKEVDYTTTRKSVYDVAGFQASVPRYLQGIPTNMINQKRVIKKQNVITIVKNICYNGGTSSVQIIEESLKALMIVKKIEAMGIKVNLDLISPSQVGWGKPTEVHVIRIRIKAAGERLNVNKMAFPMVHPSMLRRFEFRSIEVCPEIKSKDWVGGYGMAISGKKAVEPYLRKGDFYLDSFIKDVDQAIVDMEIQ